MCEKKQGDEPPAELGALHNPQDTGDEFPETETLVLREAAAGRWDTFLRAYLRPCWREVVSRCAEHGIAMPDAEDLFQELMLRLVRTSGFCSKVDEELARLGEPSNFRANLPGRYLKYREIANTAGLPLRSTRFRAYLKGVVQNLVLELIRQRRRDPKSVDETFAGPDEPWIEGSVSSGMERAWRVRCFLAALVALRAECAQARTKANRRLYNLLYHHVVEGHSASAIADRLGLDRTTVSSLLKRARHRFADLVTLAAGTTDPDELRTLLVGYGDDLAIALGRLGPLPESA
ncbi:MAG: sigma-70 family RNA polymerase sigma factor, partial [Thermoguttaceae bacterium]|nr:sigma-70 family RNA polymerase sigma factor [Thermoguttaceae bacterium]